MSDEDGPENEGGDNPQDNAMQDMIGQQLRSLYASVLEEPIPDRIVELLVKLDKVGQDDADGQAEGSTAAFNRAGRRHAR